MPLHQAAFFVMPDLLDDKKGQRTGNPRQVHREHTFSGTRPLEFSRRQELPSRIIHLRHLVNALYT
jgi:hypothetical protein